MLSYCYAWTPLVILGSFALLAIPWLGLIALMVVLAASLVALAGLAWAILWVPLRLGRAVVRRRQGRSVAARMPVTTVTWQNTGHPIQSAPATVLLTSPPSGRHR